MIEMEGRVLAGLDEFMLRVGHLSLLCQVSWDVGGSWARIQREAAEKLSLEVSVAPNENHDVAIYLDAKGLCRRADKSTAESIDSKEYVYPDLEVLRDEAGELRVRALLVDGPIRISWQDKNLSVRRVRSRVGAITWSAKSGSKTGLSHVLDWANFLELIDTAGQLSPIGRLLASLTKSEHPDFCNWNPYDLGAERLILAYQYLQRDIDLFARFAPLLLQSTLPLNKATCRRLFVQALRACAEDADASRNVAPHRQFELSQQLRDLERSARKARAEIEDTSTAWHRAASRVEMLADFGLLEKCLHGEADKFKYVYYPTEQLKFAVKTLEGARTGEEWIEHHLLETVLWKSPGGSSREDRISDESLTEGLRKIVEGLKLPTTQFPIDCLVLGLAFLNAGSASAHSLYELRRMIEAVPAKYPEVARLARGREGTRAEYLSLNIRNLAAL